MTADQFETLTTLVYIIGHVVAFGLGAISGNQNK